MPRDDWFRHITWSPSDQEDFLGCLKRSRSPANKAQYLRIQASHLAESGLHRAAVDLLDLLLRDFPERLELAQAHLQKALCLVELKDTPNAIAEFRASLQCEREFPNVRTTCWLQFPYFAVRSELIGLYDEAIAILSEFKSDSGLAFPLDRYRYAAVRALVAHARRDAASAREFAKVALQSAAAQHSGFRYHPDVGLVDRIDCDVQSRLSAIVGE